MDKINELCAGLRTKLCSVCPNEHKMDCGGDQNCKTIMHVTAIIALTKKLQVENKQYEAVLENILKASNRLEETLGYIDMKKIAEQALKEKKK